MREQQARHLKANDTAYNLEPNVKTGPGGLRDIQTIAWVAKRHFGAESLDELLTHGFLTPSELRRLKSAQSFLWKIRFGLHTLAARHEDRLLFDYQIRLAQSFGYEDASYTLAVEQLMQRYYRTAIDVRLLNELLLQLFREAILTDQAPPVPLNARFQVRHLLAALTGLSCLARCDDFLDRRFRLGRVGKRLGFVEDERLLAGGGLLAGSTELAVNTEIMLLLKKCHRGSEFGDFACLRHNQFGLGGTCFA